MNHQTKMTSNNDINEILTCYASGPAELETALSNLSETQLDSCKAPGEWTIREIANHIVDGDDIWKVGLKAALGNEGGLLTFSWYWEKPQIEWAGLWAYSSRDLSLGLALFKANRAHIVDLINHVPGAWNRSIRICWPRQEESRISVGEIIEMQVKHVAGHINDIQNILPQIKE